MSLLDTTQGLSCAGPTRGRPRRPTVFPSQRRVIRYPLVMTGISAVVAVLVAGVQLAGVGTETFGWGGLVERIGSADLETLGIYLTVVLLGV